MTKLDLERKTETVLWHIRSLLEQNPRKVTLTYSVPGAEVVVSLEKTRNRVSWSGVAGTGNTEVGFSEVFETVKQVVQETDEVLLREEEKMAQNYHVFSEKE